jgi:myo-inositol-1(or 4)-monophosphatase
VVDPVDGTANYVAGFPWCAYRLALGHAVAAVLEGYHEWDVAGAACLAAEAGAVIVDGNGRPDPLPSGAMVVAVPGALDAVLGWWRTAEG